MIFRDENLVPMDKHIELPGAGARLRSLSELGLTVNLDSVTCLRNKLRHRRATLIASRELLVAA